MWEIIQVLGGEAVPVLLLLGRTNTTYLILLCRLKSTGPFPKSLKIKILLGFPQNTY